MDMKFDFVPNHQHRWSIDFKEIPYFLTVFDNRHRAYQPDTPLRQRHDHLLFVSDDHGQLGIYSLPESTSYTQPSLVGTAELFSKNSSLLLESFAVCELAIVVYVRRFEQRTNEIEHSKLIKAGLPIMTGEQVCIDDQVVSPSSSIMLVVCFRVAATIMVEWSIYSLMMAKRSMESIKHIQYVSF